MLQSARLGREPTEFLGQTGLFLADPLGVLIQPINEFGTDLIESPAGGAKSGIGGHSEKTVYLSQGAIELIQKGYDHNNDCYPPVDFQPLVSALSSLWLHHCP
ncbi:hypothetical protein BN873_210159 [Candidatus Competibacter denitrificans Run_A_D11]|uniref:Uncharacterized protein n=1 Tax=Candidatus Competibacter denitrificans Run_A_D11 TaxID=1400863 RepID=W6MCE8_9GAMM|nr:hypothetical protein BN873_210159 [Candidatus Competibacter denitrificans Run_A_D11]